MSDLFALAMPWWEFILRAVSLYLARQYFNFREGRLADWELKGLVRMFQQLCHSFKQAAERANRRQRVTLVTFIACQAIGTATTVCRPTENQYFDVKVSFKLGSSVKHGLNVIVIAMHI